MKKDIQLLYKNLLHKDKINKKWTKVLITLSCIAIFLTIYFLISPAITETSATYTFHLVDNFIGMDYDWKAEKGVTTSYHLKLHYVDTNGNDIEGKDLTLELAPDTKYGNTPYGFGYIPQDGGIDRGLDLIADFNLEERTTSNGNRYIFDHVEVLVNGTWESFYSDTGNHWNIYCYNASINNDDAKSYTATDTTTFYGWRGNYEVASTTTDINNNTITTYKATSYQIDATTEYKIVYQLVLNGQDSVVASVGSDSGITFKIYNYEGDNTETGINANGLYNYFTFRGIGTTDKKINQDIDADGFTSNRAKVLSKLDANDNPVFDCQTKCDNDTTIINTSLGYLFGASTNAKGTATVGVTAYNPTNTPLIKTTDENEVEYYYYDSNENAVDYDTVNNRFLLRNYKERSYNMTTYEKESTRYEFLPFNYWTNTTLTASNERIYQHEVTDLDHWYGMTMEFEFYMPEDGLIKGNAMKFEFSGDDDVWVFIDDVLVLDLGGTHGAVDGSIDFSTGEVEGYLNWDGNTGTKNKTTIYEAFEAAGAINEVEWNDTKTTFKNYEKHTLKFFYLERGASVANCKIKFNIPVVPPGSLSVQKDFVGTDKYNENHEFTLYNTTSGTPQTVPNTKYTIGGVAYYTDDKGKFTLKNTEIAIFELTNEQKYYVEETTPGAHAESYACTLDGIACPSTNRTEEVTINPESTYQAIFTNKIKTFNLNISKIAYNSETNETFDFQLNLKETTNNVESPVDIPDDINSLYTVDHNNGIITFTLKSEETITIYDIPIDTIVTIQELTHDGYQTIIKSDDIVLTNGDTFEFRMDSNKDITVHNIPGVILPETGGPGTVKYLFVGLSFILISFKLGYGYFFRWKGCGK